jgi:hypothetical protein
MHQDYETLALPLSYTGDEKATHVKERIRSTVKGGKTNERNTSRCPELQVRSRETQNSPFCNFSFHRKVAERMGLFRQF